MFSLDGFVAAQEGQLQHCASVMADFHQSVRQVVEEACRASLDELELQLDGFKISSESVGPGTSSNGELRTSTNGGLRRSAGQVEFLSFSMAGPLTKGNDHLVSWLSNAFTEGEHCTALCTHATPVA